MTKARGVSEGKGAARWRRLWTGAMLAAGLAVAASPATAQDKDRHVGYYYPAPTVTEDYDAQVTVLADSSRSRRSGFVTLLTQKMLGASYPPQFIMFAKGAEAEKLIIITMGDYAANLFQARAVLAQLTAQARSTPAFQQVAEGDRLTFLDLAKMLGFEQVTVSDGRSYSLQVAIK